jgi:HAMP domain-containing protein
VHRLEERAGHFDVGGLYVQLLQIRRGEKDLGLRREVQYRDRVIGLLGAFEADVASSGLGAQLKQALSKETQAYRQAFLAYAQIVLASRDIQGGKGPFREIAHRIEDLLARHHVPGLGQDILQLRRREKDYLLRGDKQYVDMALRELSVIEQRLTESAIDAGDRQELQQLLDAYRRDFLALVEQDGKIARLDGEMRLVVTEVTGLVGANVREAEQAMAENSQRILASSAASARSMLWLAGLAALLGVVSALVITLSITRPLRRMAGLLDEVAYEQPIGRIAVVPGGRDEVNAMAESVNTLAEHKSHFLDWWKASVRSSEAAERAALEGSDPALAEWSEARQARQALADELGGKMRDLLSGVVERARGLERTHPRGRQLQGMLEIEKAARSALAVLHVMGGSGSTAKGQ